MLGFIILIGTVVNNAILIVHQSLNNVRYNSLVGMAAISDAVRTRIRPIFMSATTSLLGMMPLVVATGSGSELYRGLGSVLLGGLAMSTMFTLFVIPALLAFFIGFERSRLDETV
ncbi:MAG TPA: efflux RND transporter permease subunit, partial [Deltaproteobacteria bacterium]|nr:efflux RND transporter permease subunit [Deltaproteobacteria bacterium]